QTGPGCSACPSPFLWTTSARDQKVFTRLLIRQIIQLKLLCHRTWLRNTDTKDTKS
ncbi:hypothetical protein IRJ41_002199, partial [Triplophysa rosa]